jgi:hypothetical protein
MGQALATEAAWPVFGRLSEATLISVSDRQLT